MKKVLLALLVITLAFSLISCDSGASSSEGSESTRTLTVGTSADFPVFESHEIIDGEDTIVGFDIDLINEIGKEIGAEIVIKDMDFNGIIGAVQTGKIDLAIAGLSADEERREKVNFSDPYYQASQTILVKDDLKDITKMEDLAGKTIGSQLGSTSDDVISEYADMLEVKKYNKATDAVLDLNNERIDGVIIEDTIAKAFVQKNPELNIVVPDGLNDEEVPFAIAVPKEDEELLEEINTALQNIKDSGKYDELVSKWFE